MNDLKQTIKKEISKGFSGIVTLDISHKNIISEIGGLRDISNNLPVNLETKFGIASGTKIFTALGIGVLIDKGKLKLESKVWDIFGKELSYIGKEATIKDLLCHKSGIYDYLDEELMDDEDYDDDFNLDIPLYKLLTPTDYLPLFNDKKPKFEPGERCSYSNGGYVLLGVIIELLSGELYRDFITNNILKKCNMKSSGFFFFNNLPENTAVGYKEEKKKLVANYYSIPIVGGADGGMYTTVHDLKKFWDSLVRYKILSKALTELFLTPTSKIEESDYGLGMYISGEGDEKDLYLYGCDPGVGFHSRYKIKNARLINIISNKTWGIEEISNGFWSCGI